MEQPEIKVGFVQTKSIMTKSNGPLGGYSVNPYVGCPHACKYCYASFMKRFTGHTEDWGTFMDVKEWPAITNPQKYAGQKVIVGTVTDGYNPLEEKFGKTRLLLEQLKDSGADILICTKSDLVLRDMDLLTEINKRNRLTVSWSVNTLDENFKNDTVEFYKGRFEDTDLPTEHFDVVFAAQSFHWIPQPQGFEKCADILKENGYLAILYNMYVTTDCERDRELLALSDKHGGFADFVDESKCDERISNIVANIENSKKFSGVIVFKTSWVKDYTAEEYFGFVLTGNKILQKDENEKKIIYNDIVNLANKNNGIIHRPFLCVLYLSEKANY